MREQCWSTYLKQLFQSNRTLRCELRNWGHRNDLRISIHFRNGLHRYRCEEPCLHSFLEPPACSFGTRSGYEFDPLRRLGATLLLHIPSRWSLEEYDPQQTLQAPFVQWAKFAHAVSCEEIWKRLCCHMFDHDMSKSHDIHKLAKVFYPVWSDHLLYSLCSSAKIVSTWVPDSGSLNTITVFVAFTFTRAPS